MSTRPAATRPEIGPSSAVKKVMAKTNRATGTSTAPVPNPRPRRWPMALVTGAVEGATTEMNIAMASTAKTTPMMSLCAVVRPPKSAAAACAARDCAWRLLLFFLFFAAFELRLEGI